jgi:hypothetical protein
MAATAKSFTNAVHQLVENHRAGRNASAAQKRAPAESIGPRTEREMAARQGKRPRSAITLLRSTFRGACRKNTRTEPGHRQVPPVRGRGLRKETFGRAASSEENLITE